MYKVDLHTHSVVSHDGGINAAQYEKVLAEDMLDMIAVTDHNRIDFATQLRKDLGDRIIVGEEIMSTSGEIIGLYLEEAVPSGLSPLETVKRIKDQNGIVYIPHPFESVRKGLHPSAMEELVDYIDIVEVVNGRAFLQNRSAQAAIWARLNHVVGAAGSDAHGLKGLGRTYTRVHDLPKSETLLHEIAHGTPITARPSPRSLLYPKYHRLKKKLSRTT